MFSEICYHVWRFMAFKSNDQSYGHIHGIVCSNDLILCTRVHLGIPNNVNKGSFHFLCTEIHFPFSECPKWVFFVKDLPNNCCKNGPNQFYKILAMYNAQLTKWLGEKSFYPPLVKQTNSRRFRWKRIKFELQLPCSFLFIFFKNHF